MGLWLHLLSAAQQGAGRKVPNEVGSCSYQVYRLRHPYLLYKEFPAGTELLQARP